MTLRDAFERAHEPLPRGTMVVVVQDQSTDEGERVPAGTQARVQEPWGVHGRPRTGPVAIATLGGELLAVPRAALVLQRGGPTPPAPVEPDAARWERLRPALQLVTQVGSRAWNLSVAGSDEDRRGFYLAPFELLASLDGAPEQLEDPQADGVYWELEKLLRLGLKADPNVIEALWGPVIEATPLGEQVLAARGAFLSRRVLDTFGRYALAQLERLEARERRNRLLEEAAALLRGSAASGDVEDQLAARLEGREGITRRRAAREAKEVLKDLARSLHDRGLTPDRHPASVDAFLRGRPADPEGWLVARSDKPKNAMHLLRILHSGLSLIAGGPPLIRVEEGPLRQRLLAVRQGQVPFAEVLEEARGLAAQLEAAGRASPLPPEGDRAAAEALLRAGRRLACARDAAPAQARPLVAVQPPLPEGLPEPLLRGWLAARPERTVLAVISGSHAYGFPSADSDVDLKGIHVAPLDALLGLGPTPETASYLGFVEGVELDFTSHELGKACHLLLRGDGNVLEWITGALVVEAHPRIDELRALARQNLHRGFGRHYAGFSRSLLTEYERERAKGGAGRIKPLLYALRTALSGLHLLESGECLPNLPRLIELYPAWGAVAELIARKRAGGESALLEGDDANWLTLCGQAQAALEAAREASALPEAPPARAALSAWVAALRRGG